MKKGFRTRASLACLLGLMLFLAGSCVYVGSCGMQAKYEKQVSLSAPLGPGSAFSAETRDGSIAVEGTATTECTLLATIRACAGTEESARELAEQIEVKLEPSADGLRVLIEKPAVIRNAHYSVSLTAKVPTQTNLALVTSDGAVHVANITGRVDAKTSDGSIQAENINGNAKLRTSDGVIACAEVTADTLDLHTNDGSIKLSGATVTSCTSRTSDGSVTFTNVRGDDLQLQTSDGAIRCQGISASRINCRTSDGAIQIECAPDAPKAPDVEATTSDGSITFVAPPGLSAVVEAVTADGSIHTQLPITIEGKVGKSLRGTVGAGEGRVYLKTHDGSITVR